VIEVLTVTIYNVQTLQLMYNLVVTRGKAYIKMNGRPNNQPGLRVCGSKEFSTTVTEAPKIKL